MDKIPCRIREIAGELVGNDLNWLVNFLMTKFNLQADQARQIIREKLDVT